MNNHLKSVPLCNGEWNFQTFYKQIILYEIPVIANHIRIYYNFRRRRAADVGDENR